MGGRIVEQRKGQGDGKKRGRKRYVVSIFCRLFRISFWFANTAKLLIWGNHGLRSHDPTDPRRPRNQPKSQHPQLPSQSTAQPTTHERQNKLIRPRLTKPTNPTQPNPPTNRPVSNPKNPFFKKTNPKTTTQKTKTCFRGRLYVPNSTYRQPALGSQRK
jgi:hypothetical protein